MTTEMEEKSATTSDVEIQPAAPGSPSSQSTTEALTTGGSRHKRHRDDMGPTTPRGDDDTKVLGGLTPLAKKGRVQTGAKQGKQAAVDGGSGNATSLSPAKDHTDLEEHDDDEEEDDDTKSTPPRTVPMGLDTNSPPPTPLQATSSLAAESREPPKTEGKETQAIRRRVANLEWEDGEQPISATKPTGSDIEIAEVAAEVSESAEMVEGEQAQVADEVSETAAQLAKEDEKIEDKQMVEDEANVAADVAVSAKMLAKEDEAKEAEDVQIADVAAEVATSAVKVDQKDAEDKATADVAAEVAESSKVVAPETPTKPAPTATPSSATAAPTSITATPPVQTSFSAFSSSASPFVAVAGASPLAAVAKTSESAASSASAADETVEQKPKSRSSFGGALASSTTVSVTQSSLSPSPATTESTPIASTSSTSESSTKPVPAFAKSTASSTFGTTPSTNAFSGSNQSGGASPFSAFASTSGFAAAAKPATTSTSAFGASSASSGFGSYTGASPFASLASKPTSGRSTDEDSSRKLGEPEEIDETKRVFTEQEVVTGEEEDELIHSVRSKLFVMNDGGWVERGVGLLRLNRTRGNEDKLGARLVMRADATHRLLLNATLFPKFSIELSQEKYVRLAIIENGEPVSYMLRLSGPTTATALVNAVREQVDRLE